MEKLIDILKKLHPDIDFMQETGLIDKKILDSFDLITLLSEISYQMQVVIPPRKITPENFNSAEAIWNLITELAKR